MVYESCCKIDADLKAAMIARDAEKLSVLRMLKSAVKYAAIEKGGADSVPSDLEVLAVVRKEAKKREDSIASFTKAGRTELADEGEEGTGVPEDVSARAVDAGKDGGAGEGGHRRGRRDQQGADGFGDEGGAGQGGGPGRWQDAEPDRAAVVAVDAAGPSRGALFRRRRVAVDPDGDVLRVVQDEFFDFEPDHLIGKALIRSMAMSSARVSSSLRGRLAAICLTCWRRRRS